MTTTTTTTPEPLARLVPPGADPLDDLTVQELGIIGRQLRCDPYAAIKDESTGLRWEAFGRIAWLWAKRTDPQARVDVFLGKKATEVAQLLGLDGRDDDDVDDVDDGDDVEAAPEENPTVCAPGS